MAYCYSFWSSMKVRIYKAWVVSVLGPQANPLTLSSGVLSRQESLAINLGAKLTAPRLIKAIESAVEGTIVTTPPQAPRAPHSVRWPDIIQYTRLNPSGYTIVVQPDGSRVCQFHLKGVQVEIMEVDWRLIATGALDSMVPEGPIDEDEASELATVDILEARLDAVTHAAEEVAMRSKRLAYALEGRRSGLMARREARGSPRGFQPVNEGHLGNVRRNTTWMESRGADGGDLHADLLQQFNATSPSPNIFPRSMYGVSNAGPPPHMSPPIVSPNHANPHGLSYVLTSPTNRYAPIAPSGRLPPPPPPPRRDPAVDDADTVNRPLIMRMVETLGKGDEIAPPCDRCRRLKLECVKHLTACQGCTRKHAKCTWRTASESEMAGLRTRGRKRKAELRVDTGGGAAEEKREGGKGEAGLEKRPGGETPMSRMDIDAIMTPDTAPRPVPGTGLPRDPNFLGSPADKEERGALSSPIPAQQGHSQGA